MPKKLTQEDFIQRAKKVHGDKYDYSEVNYINSSTKVKIICPIHGGFEQIPNNHLRGAGCFDTEHEAYEAYKKAKYAEIKSVATEAFGNGEITKHIYDCLINFRINEQQPL